MGVLTKLQCDRIKPGEKLFDGANLMLVADSTGTRVRWILRYRSPVVTTDRSDNKRRRDAGLGNYPETGLTKARERAEAFRSDIKAGRDPLHDRKLTAEAARKAIAAQAAEAERSEFTLANAARAYHATVAPTFKNEKHAVQWLASLENHVFERLGDKPLDEITADDLLALLLPLRDSVPETAKRVRLRLDAIYADAILRGRVKVNPAAAIARAMRSKNAGGHHAALPYQGVPEFLRRLRENLVAALPVKLAFEFLILTAARTAEILEATWDEVNGAEWTVPGARMKRGKAHWVPLPPAALAVLERAREIRLGPFIFGLHDDRAMSNGVFLQALKRLRTGRELDGEPEFYSSRTTAHGFRSSFSTWAREKTSFKDGVIEAALAHREADQVAAAYSRAEYRQHRRELADLWAAYATGAESGNVIEFARKK